MILRFQMFNFYLFLGLLENKSVNITGLGFINKKSNVFLVVINGNYKHSQ